VLSPSSMTYLRSTNNFYSPFTSPASDAASATEARSILRFVRHELNEFRESYWVGPRH
jgi:hypothetical protein